MRESSMLKIGEFARVGQVTVATLRHYDHYGLLRASALDPDTGYRYYTLDQLPHLYRILALKELGFPLENIARLLEKNLSLEQLQAMFMLKQTQTQQLIENEQMRLKQIAARLRQIEQEGRMPTYEILLKNVDSLSIASIRDRVPFISEHEELYKNLFIALQRENAKFVETKILILHTRHEMRDEVLSIDLEVAVPLQGALPANEQITTRTLLGGLVASIVHTGGNLLLGQAYVALYLWLAEHGYRLSGPPRQLFLQEETSIHPSQNVIEIQFPVEKADSSSS